MIIRQKGTVILKWTNEDLAKYVEAKEYVDTIILPMQAFQVSDEKALNQDAFNLEVLSIYASEIEKELSGRVLLTPTYYYVKSADMNAEIERLTAWVEEFQQQPFEKIFIFTFDKTLKKLEKELPCELIWFPGMKIGDVRSKEAGQLIRNQVEQISELIRSYW